MTANNIVAMVAYKGEIYMKSKLNPDKYSIMCPFDWLIFSKGWQKQIDFVFACRLAALAQSMNKKINISSGYRSTQEQINAYIGSGGKLVNGVWTGGSGYVAKPGNSWHEYRLAIDTSDSWLKALEKDLATADQKTLMKCGLFKPLTKGNKTSITEDWHIQPIETKDVSNRNSLVPELNNKLAKGSRGFDVLELQWRLNRFRYMITADGVFGANTENAVKEFQRSRGLTADGIVGPMTWEKLYEA